jgi:hypothetical protein
MQEWPHGNHKHQSSPPMTLDHEERGVTAQQGKTIDTCPAAATPCWAAANARVLDLAAVQGSPSQAYRIWRYQSRRL